MTPLRQWITNNRRDRSDQDPHAEHALQAAYLFQPGTILVQGGGVHGRRDIFAAVSERWGDPRARLLDGEAWQQAKAPALNALQRSGAQIAHTPARAASASSATATPLRK
jgi:hypothetical protein